MGAISVRARGFTLVEMVIAIALIGLLALAAAPLLKLPLSAWLDASRRSGLASQIQAAEGLVAQDLARALPGSVRVRQVGARVLVEFIEVRATGRYRAGPSGAAQTCPATCSSAGRNDVLEPGCADACFTSLGPLLGDVPVPGTDWVIVNPLGPGVAAGDPYFGGNVRVNGGIKSRLQAVAVAADGQRLTIAAHAYPNASTLRRFYVASGPVTLDCNPATGSLARHSGYAFSAVQPTGFGAAVSATMVDNVTACGIELNNGLLQWNLRLSTTAADTRLPENVQWTAQFALREQP
jgi:prepilin-type N-terminal cleavage/methylation domain-containing protein